MKIQIASDLHLESLPADKRVQMVREEPHGSVRVRESSRADLLGMVFKPVPGRDLLVLAGDVGKEMLARELVEQELLRSPVLYVPGNHEYYSERSREDIDSEWQWLAAQHKGLHYLTGQAVEIDGVRFWGGPWYSDLWGTTDPNGLARIQNGINDFWHPNNGGGEWTLSRHINHCHAQTDLLRTHAGQVDVVVTHWPPTKGALHPKFEGDSQNPYFINDREDLVCEMGAKLWIAGHTHEAFDYQVGATRVVGNPAGYIGEQRESSLFRPDKVVEIAP